ncbi:hypothetical protein [Streptomyces albireticuli]|uniref:Uncharacterized protein n=1 Tax=Streptomyces albireticuli TaxID=1940 RepID=A0A2A2DBI4_9ACTN|nr:hypothetical protein [Streptomyces albireticuli]MCD9145481.1 hypothetical protein [Streptomyces albireticuli]MCD9164954.1 hypothetical protein [Streptomyces albireticuli]MCD9195455.1 hypothetical protein [Streptomyces albireticuli]PAU48739.1 hypothetical protein CK936_11890 [Streptomyces albireticuli]
MNDTGAAAGGIGAVALGLVVLFYQIGRWRGGDPTPKIHFIAGTAIAALLFLGGGILGVMGGAAAALGDGLGRYALENATGAAAGAGNKGPLTGGEKVGASGAIAGLCLLALYLGLIKSGRADLKQPVIRGALCGIWLGASAGLLGMALGLIRTSGNTVGDILIRSI